MQVDKIERFLREKFPVEKFLQKHIYWLGPAAIIAVGLFDGKVGLVIVGALAGVYCLIRWLGIRSK